MIKSELILRVAAMNPHLYEADIKRVVHTILGQISDALVAGDRVELRGFGVFTVTERGPRNGRNPGTGGTVRVEAKKLLNFKPVEAIRARLNPSGAVTGAELDAEVEQRSRGP